MQINNAVLLCILGFLLCILCLSPKTLTWSPIGSLGYDIVDHYGKHVIINLNDIFLLKSGDTP